MDKHSDSTPCKILWNILKMDKWRSRTNVPKGKDIDDDIRGLSFERWYTDNICQEKEEEEDLQALRIVSIQRLDEYKRKSKERLITEASNNNGSGRSNGKTIKTSIEAKGYCINFSSDKMARWHMIKLGHGLERETSKRNWVSFNTSTK